MNLLDLYLQKNDCKRYDVYKKTGFSQQLLSSYTRKEVEKYPVKILIAISKTLNKSPGVILDEMLKLQEDNSVFEVFNPSELHSCLKNNDNKIVIRGKYCSEIYELIKVQSLEYELMGGALDVSVLIHAISKVKDLFSSPNKKMDADIERKLRLYRLEEVSRDQLVLVLK